MKNILDYDYIVVGSGLAGLTSALTLAKYGTVAIMTKQKLTDSASNLAQGGIAAIVVADDSVELFTKDTLKAGDFHNDPKAVALLARKSRDAVDWLSRQGVIFATKNSNFLPSMEAAHSKPRIVHTSDFTGRDIIKSLILKARKNRHVTFLEETFVVDALIKDKVCYGVSVLQNGSKELLFAKFVVLATGGAGQVYQWTTNPEVATGDGIAIASRAGVKLADMEFVQFHPTALKHGRSPLFLLSERLRGEGAHLVDIKGKRFVDDLSPRDELSRAIFEKQKTSEVFLTISHLDKYEIKRKFPNIFKRLKTLALDLIIDKIPITPAAHYLCGGVKTDLHGRTSIRNLYAVGEVAATGVHGANRLASNSLLEAVVFGREIGKYIGRQRMDDRAGKSEVKQWKMDDRRLLTEAVKKEGELMKMKTRLQKILWEKVGIIRTKKGLNIAHKELQQLKKEVAGNRIINQLWLELENMIEVSLLIIESALRRKISLGAHYIADK